MLRNGAVDLVVGFRHFRNGQKPVDDRFHVGGMDCCARGLKAAAKIIEDKALSAPLEERYAGWSEPDAKKMLDGSYSLEEISTWALDAGIDPQPVSGRQERLENIVNRYV